MDGYMALMLKMDNSDEITESDRYDCVCDILERNMGVRVAEDDPIVREISDRIGSMWADLPMPVAAADIPDLIEMFYKEISKH